MDRREATAMAAKTAQAASEAGVTTQMGIQIHATENYRRVVEIVFRKTVVAD